MEDGLKTWRPRLMEAALLFLVIAIAWGLLTLPIVFYHLPDEYSAANHEMPEMLISDNNRNCSMLVQSSDVCSSVTTYEGEVCKVYLQGFQKCLSRRAGSSDISIVPQENHNAIEMLFASLLDSNVLFQGDSPECEEEMKSFFCVSSFQMCGWEEGWYAPSCDWCLSLRDGTCAALWSRAVELIQSVPGDLLHLLPCESLPGSCTGDDLFPTSSGNEYLGSSSEYPGSSGEYPGSSGVDNVLQPGLRNCSTIQCSEGFYCTVDATSDISVCRPRCDTWKQYSYAAQASMDVVIFGAGIIGLATGIAALVITGIRWRQVMKFPSVFSVYLNISLTFFAFLNLLSFVDRSTLYCSSTDLIDSVDNPTFFCSLSGALLYYIILQAVFFWLVHVASLFYMIKFPVRARNFQKPKSFKYIHIAMVLIALAFPAVSVVVVATTGGITLGSFPPQLCAGRNPDAVFYSFLMPAIFMSQVGITLLLLLFHFIHKHHGLFHAKKAKRSIRISTAERKILISFCYSLITVVVATVTNTLYTRDATNFEKALEQYFVCEAFAPNNSCDRSAYLDFTHPEMLAIAFMLIELFPVVNLIYVVDFERLKQLFGHQSRSRIFSISEIPNSSNIGLAKV